MWNSKLAIAIFGSSRTVDGHEEYEQARKLGYLLALSNFVVCNGGYRGMMEATARGANEAGGVTVGINLTGVEECETNPYIIHEMRMPSLFERLRKFVELADGFVVLRGGVGTLAETFVVWNLMQSHLLDPRPFIFMGEFWQQMIEHLRKHMEIRDKDIRLLDFVLTPEQAVKILEERVSISR
jgi:uncharacterized protein (TIGR00730 family)